MYVIKYMYNLKKTICQKNRVCFNKEDLCDDRRTHTTELFISTPFSSEKFNKIGTLIYCLLIVRV